MHTKEPWKVGEFGGIYQAAGGACIVSALTPSGFLPNSIANERRIVACVNACRPLTTESLEMHGLAGITSSTERILREQCDTAMDERIAAGKHIEELEQHRDELLKALEGVLPFLTGEYWPGVIADTAVDFAVATARKVAAAKVTQS